MATAGGGVFRDVYRGVLGGVDEPGDVHAVEPEDGCVERSGGAGGPAAEPTPLERQGANVFQQKQCRNCHQLGGLGGQRGPALDEVATRLTEDQLYRQVLLGGGNMPAYGSALSPAETTALVRFLETLHPNYQPPSQDASRQVVGQGGGADYRRGDSTQRGKLDDGLMLIDDGANGVPALGDLLRTWSLPMAPLITLSIALVLYLRGWMAARVTRGRELPVWRAACFVAGCAVVVDCAGFAD